MGKIYKPACGKDGKTYSNSCGAQCKNVEYTDGRCEDTGNGGSGEVCVKEMKACTADKTCGMLHAKFLHYKLQEAKKAGGYGSKGGDGKDHDNKPKEYGQNGEKKGSESYGGKGGD